MMLALLLSPAFATSGFDPAAPAEVFTEDETYTIDGAIRLWAEIARYEDPDNTLFGAVTYNSLTEWPDADSFTPWIATCFGTQRPAASDFLLHVTPGIGLARGTPILFVPGAGDNASRGFITMATHMDIEGRPVFAMTFAHSHGDVYQQAEIVADAIAVVKARTGASQIDVVSHSKGGIATAVYLSNQAGTEWDGGAYEAVGTPYRGDVRRAVFIATPLGGIDTSFRWPAGNLLSLDADTAFSPSAWSTYYAYTTAYYWLTTPLTDQDFLPDGDDLFPGHRQLLARQDYPLPGEVPSLGAYALQPDWYTTYEGGLGSVSDSEGIDAAVTAGGNLLDHLGDAGVDPSVEIFLLAGENPLMPNGADTSSWVTEYYGEMWGEYSTETTRQWSEFVAAMVGDSLLSEGVSEGEVQGIVSGDLVLGEVSGPSDGLVFVSSATDGSRLTARGAVVMESKTVNLSHLDLLYASPITGELLIDDAGTDASKAWQAALGERYTAADTINWVERVLEDDANPVDTGGGGDDTGDTDVPADDTGAPDETGEPDDTDPDGSGFDEDDEDAELGCGSCNVAGGAPLWMPWLIVGLVAGRRRSR